MGIVQYISDDSNNITGVIVPIDLWHALQSEKEVTIEDKILTQRVKLIELLELTAKPYAVSIDSMLTKQKSF